MQRNSLVSLGLLSECPMHGYQIIQEIKKRSMDMWAKISIASIYNVLIMLEKKRFISVKKEKIEKMPERNVYQITEQGMKELANLVKEGLSKKTKISNVEFHLSVAFMGIIACEEAVESLKKRKEQIEAAIFNVKNIKKEHEKILPFNWMYIIDISLQNLETDLNGTNYLIGKVEELKRKGRGKKK